MQDIKIAAASFVRLLEYIDSLGLDEEKVACAAGVNLSELSVVPGDTPLSAQLYSCLYRQAVKEMQTVHPHIPWAAGLGTDAFDMLCYSIMGCATLGEALARVERFESLLRPLSGRHLRLVREGDRARLEYYIDTDNVEELFVPRTWHGAKTFRPVALASGLVVWHAFCGWLIGHSLEALSIQVAAPAVNSAYQRSWEKVTGCPIRFSAACNCIEFPLSILDYRVVQDQQSLQQFLDMAVYQLSSVERQPASIGEAIKSLLGRDFKAGLPSFTEIAERLHLSESSLRRKLLKEQTSFQMIKDQARCDAAKQLLAQGVYKINDVAEELGFTEPSSFVRSFRNWTGMTPKSYRDRQTTGLVSSH